MSSSQPSTTGTPSSSASDDEPDPVTDDPGPPEPAVDPADESSTDPEQDRWRRFADTEPEPTSPPDTRRRRWTGRAVTVLRHEWTIAALVSLLLAVAMNWDVLADPAHTVPHDLGDPLQQVFTLAWPGYILLRDPGALWNAPNFFPDPHSYAFTDTLLGYAPLSLLGTGPEAALIRYNIVYLLTFALAFFGCYVLLRQLGARVAGSAVGAAAFAFAPWKLAHGGHLNILSVGGIALALAMLARGHGWSLRRGYRANRTRWGWALAGWLVATWQVSLGFGLGVPFGYLLAGIVVVSAVIWAVKRHHLDWRLLCVDAVGALGFAVASLALSLPYFQVLREHPEAARSPEYLDFFSPTWSGFLISPPESGLWGDLHAPAREGMTWPPETAVLVGFTLLALAMAGLVWSVWTRRQRAFLAVGVAGSVILALGTNFIDDGAWAYRLLFDYLPGFDGLRTPGRLVLYTTLLLAILAAGTLTHLADRLDRHTAAGAIDDRWRLRVPAPVRAALLLPMVLILMEGYSVADVPAVPTAPVALSSLDQPILVLPSGGSQDYAAQLWDTDGFPRIVNGTAGFVPDSQEEIRRDAYTFPARSSVAALREAGIATVVVVREQLPGTPWEHLLDVPFADASVTVTDLGPVVVFGL